MTKVLFKPVKQDFEKVTSRLESLIADVEAEANAAEKVAASSHREVVEARIEFTNHKCCIIISGELTMKISSQQVPGPFQMARSYGYRSSFARPI